VGNDDATYTVDAKTVNLLPDFQEI
jgi:hypothetical protein